MPVILTRFLNNQEISDFTSIRHATHEYRLCGFIIVRVVDGKCLDYVDSFCELRGFGDETKSEDPKTYLDMPILNRALGRYKVKFDYCSGTLEIGRAHV